MDGLTQARLTGRLYRLLGRSQEEAADVAYNAPTEVMMVLEDTDMSSLSEKKREEIEEIRDELKKARAEKSFVKTFNRKEQQEFVARAMAPSGNNIAEKRKAVGMSQTELCEKAGITLKALQRWEYGTLPTGIVKCVCIARALGTTVEELVGEAEGGCADEKS